MLSNLHALFPPTWRRYRYLHFTDEELRFREFPSEDQSLHWVCFTSKPVFLMMLSSHPLSPPNIAPFQDQISWGSIAYSRPSLWDSYMYDPIQGSETSSKEESSVYLFYKCCQNGLILEPTFQFIGCVCWFLLITKVNVLSVIMKQLDFEHRTTTSQTMKE